MNTSLFFLSYSSEDRAHVEAVASELRARDLNTWLDRDEIGAGASIIEEIEAGLQQFKFFVAFVSKSYLEKTWTMLEYRAGLFAALGTRERSVVVVRLDNAQLPPLIAHRRYVTFGTAAQVAEELTNIVTHDVTPKSIGEPKEQPWRSVTWESLQHEVVDTILNELLDHIPQLRGQAQTALVPFEVQLSRKLTILLSLSRAILNNRQLEAQVRTDRETLFYIQTAQNVNRGLLRENGVGIFAGGFEADIIRKQRAIDELNGKLRGWLAAISPELSIVDPSTTSVSSNI